ncbi:lipase 3-like [Haematobia irritans]|uniref:lipase 3-like n=1 Tax=Haematobia irritans TaxID=7368 RepID=UPI003F5007A3
MKPLFIISLILVPIVLVWLKILLPNEVIEPLTTTDRVKRAGYTCETHDVETKDGYGLSIFRIGAMTKPLSANTSRPLVLLMHGFLSSSDAWVIEGLNNPLVYDLVNQGYDVWLGNNRGNPYGRRHKNLTTDSREFWHFSFHEIGTMDLPATIEYILQHTHQTSLHFVGSSQGSTVAFVLLSENPEYQRQFKSLTMLAPTVLPVYVTTPLKYASGILGIHTPWHVYLGDSCFLGSKLLRLFLGLEKCQSKSANTKFCLFVLHYILGGYTDYIDEVILPDVFLSHPSTASLHQFFHFMQMHHSKTFLKYNWGPEENLKRYNQTLPPLYELSNINPRFPIHIFYSGHDELCSKQDAENLLELLGKRSVGHFIDLKDFGHMAFSWASNIRDVINLPVLDIINEVEFIFHKEYNKKEKLRRKAGNSKYIFFYTNKENIAYPKEMIARIINIITPK